MDDITDSGGIARERWQGGRALWYQCEVHCNLTTPIFSVIIHVPLNLLFWRLLNHLELNNNCVFLCIVTPPLIIVSLINMGGHVLPPISPVVILS